MPADPIADGGGYPGHWSGRFVWYGDERYPFHRFLMARRAFRLPAAPRRARLAITAEDRYVLYVNGTYLGRGPARSDPRWKSYDTYDVAAVLQPGRNAIAVLAYHYGCQNNYSRDARAGLFVHLDAEAGDGTRTTLGTDGTWRVRPAQGWRRDVGLVSVTVGVTEVYDARADPPDWYATGFDDDAWEPAQVIAEQMASWAYLEPRQTPMLQESRRASRPRGRAGRDHRAVAHGGRRPGPRAAGCGAAPAAAARPHRPAPATPWRREASRPSCSGAPTVPATTRGRGCARRISSSTSAGRCSGFRGCTWTGRPAPWWR